MGIKDWLKKKDPPVELTAQEEQRAKDELYNEKSEYIHDIQEANLDIQEFTRDELEEISLIAKELKTVIDLKELFSEIKQHLRAVSSVPPEDKRRAAHFERIGTIINQFSSQAQNIVGAFGAIHQDCVKSIKAANELQELARKHEVRNKQGHIIQVIDKFEEDILQKSEGLGKMADEVKDNIIRYAEYDIKQLEDDYKDLHAQKTFDKYFGHAFNMLEVLEARTKGIAAMLKAMQDVGRSVDVSEEIEDHWEHLIKEIGRGVVYEYSTSKEMETLLRRAGILQEVQRRA